MDPFARPFCGSAAIRSRSLTVRQLRSFERIHRDVYVRPGACLDPLVRAEAAVLWAGDDGILGGYSAAALSGMAWIDDTRPAELYRTGSRRRPVAGIIVHADTLEPDEFGVHEVGLVTTIWRTAYDLGRRRPSGQALADLDALCRATGFKPADVLALAGKHRGARGIVQLRKLLALVDGGAESPQESRTRLVLIDAGLPAPTTQIPVSDRFGHVVARLDMGWERWQVAVEYDGQHHWTDEAQRTWDIERAETLKSLGWAHIRVNAEQLRDRPWSIAARAKQALRQRGARW